MAGWTTQKELLRMEIKQREEEGCDVRGFAERFARLGADPAAVESLYDELMALQGRYYRMWQAQAQYYQEDQKMHDYLRERQQA